MSSHGGHGMAGRQTLPKTTIQLFVSCVEVFGQKTKNISNLHGRQIRNPGRDISFPIFTRKEIGTKRIRKEIKTIISRLNHFLSLLSNV